MIKKGDKVMMCRDDRWAQGGWTGVVTVANSINIRVQWDNGSCIYHHAKDLKIITPFHIRARVVMKTADGLTKKGQCGTILNASPGGVRVIWDKGATYWHAYENLSVIENQESDPNIVFMLQKKENA